MIDFFTKVTCDVCGYSDQRTNNKSRVSPLQFFQIAGWQIGLEYRKDMCPLCVAEKEFGKLQEEKAIRK